MTAPELRPRPVTIAFWLWLLAAVLLISMGLLSALSGQVLGFYRSAGVLWVVAGIGLGFLAGRTRLGDSRFRRAGIALSLALAVVLAIFSVLSGGWPWLVIMVILIIAAVLLVRPTAQDWFTQVDERNSHA